MTTQPDTTTSPRDAILKTAAELGLTMTAKFIPWSQSRNKAEKQPSLNWSVTIERNGRAILTTDYSAGCAHAPSYRQADRSLHGEEMVRWECENGKHGIGYGGGNIGSVQPRRELKPELVNVLYSLSMDYDVLDSANYEDWASDLGYDPDSRKGEAIYRACLDIALALRNGVGEAGMTRLREACQDY